MSAYCDKSVVFVVIHRFGEDQLRIVAMFETSRDAHDYVQSVQKDAEKPLEWYIKGVSGWDDTWEIATYTLGDLWHLPQSKD